MRNPVLILLLLIIGLTKGFAQCNVFYQLEAGSMWEMENFNAKGKLTGKNAQKVIAFDGNSDSFTAKINSVISDEKGKEVMHGDLDFSCNNGTMIIDMRNFVSEEQMKAFESYELKIEAENLEVPNSLSVGESLKDGVMTVTAMNSPIPMTMNISITNRKIVGKESVTTPAGTFECYKITSDLTVETKMAIGFTLSFSTVEWLAPKVAVVKSESYKKGKLQGYSLLAKIGR